MKMKARMLSHIFSPLDIPGCVIWLEADRGITKDETNLVSAWVNYGSLGGSATQSVSGTRPLYTPNSWQGHPTIGFNKTGLDISYLQPNDMTAIFVMQRTGADASYSLVMNRNGTHYCLYTFASRQPGIYSGASPSQVVVATSITSLSVVRYRWTLSPNLMIAAVNGGAEVSATGTTVRETFTTIGYYAPDKNVQPFVGNMAAIVMYGRALSITEFQRIERHFGSKYGITVA
jgi:hypothetical protein